MRNTLHNKRHLPATTTSSMAVVVTLFLHYLLVPENLATAFSILPNTHQILLLGNNRYDHRCPVALTQEFGPSSSVAPRPPAHRWQLPQVVSHPLEPETSTVMAGSDGMTSPVTTTTTTTTITPLPIRSYRLPTKMTLSRYMMELAKLNPELDEIESIFTSLQVACKTLSHLIRTSTMNGLSGLQNGGGSMNIQGEEQKQLDVIANDIVQQSLEWSGEIKLMVSEEDEYPIPIGGNTSTNQQQQQQHHHSKDILVEHTGRYTAVFDPLDGSSNIDAGIPVGTIFGIFETCDQQQTDDASTTTTTTLQSGRQLVAAGYCLYSSATTFVFTIGSGVIGFTYDEQLGEFVMTHPDMKIPTRGKIYSFNEANRWDWDIPLQQYITNLQQGLGETETRYSSRYIGSLVADVHRTLQYGGIFGYPADTRNPQGKLRLLYEAAPMAFLMEQAGGMAISTTTTTTTADSGDDTTTTSHHHHHPRIMDLPPTSIHQRVPCILGSRDDVLELQKYYDESKDDDEVVTLCKSCLLPFRSRKPFP